MTTAPCRYCHQAPQPPGVACPSAKGVTMHGCEATTGEPSAQAREAARGHVFMVLQSAQVATSRHGDHAASMRPATVEAVATKIAAALDAFAARAVSAERRRLREMVSGLPSGDLADVIECVGLNQPHARAVAAFVADLRGKP